LRRVSGFGLTVAGRGRGTHGTVQCPISVRFLGERRAILRQRLPRPAELQQHVGEELTRRREWAGRHGVLVRRVLAHSGFPHARQRGIFTMLGEIEPRLRTQMLDRHLLRPVRFTRGTKTIANRRQRVDRRARAGDVAGV